MYNPATLLAQLHKQYPITNPKVRHNIILQGGSLVIWVYYNDKQWIKTIISEQETGLNNDVIIQRIMFAIKRFAK